MNLYDGGETAIIEVAFKAADTDKQIVYGEVYVPNVVDSHGEMMLPVDVELMAHRFMAEMKNDRIDVMHDNKCIEARVVESFVARKGDPDYHEGSWVLATYIEDKEIWKKIKRGELNGYSIETYVRKVEAVVDFSYYPHVWGLSEKVDGHNHYFFIQLDEDGNICCGRTSVEKGHSHEIALATATEMAKKHAHRIQMP